MAVCCSRPNPGAGSGNDNSIPIVSPKDFVSAAVPRFKLRHAPLSFGVARQQERHNLGAALQGRGKAQRFRRLLLTITVRNERFFLNFPDVSERPDLQGRFAVRTENEVDVDAMIAS